MGVIVLLPEGAFRQVEVIQVFHILLHLLMVFVPEQMPVQRTGFAPFVKLRKFPAHEQQLFAGMTVHETVGQTQICVFLPQVAGHLADHGALFVYHFVMGQYQHKVFGIIVCHTESQVIVVILPVDGVFFDIKQEVVHPAHVPLHGEAQTVVVGALCNAFPRCGFFRDHHGAGQTFGHDGVHVLDKFHSFQIFSAAVFVGSPFAVILAEIQIQHGRNGVYTQTVDVVFIQPEQRVGNEEVADFFSAVVENIGTPLEMFSPSGILMFIQCCAVEPPQTKFVFGEVGRHPVQNDADAVLMAGVDKFFEHGRCAVAAGRCVVSCHLIAPAAVKRMFFHRQQFNVAEAHFFHIRHQFFRHFRIGQEAVAFFGHTHPGTQMDFINIHGRRIDICFLSGGHPFSVFPFIPPDRVDHRGCFRAQLCVESVRVALVHLFASGLYHMEFILIHGSQTGNEQFPDTGLTQQTHGMSAGIPAVEVPNDADAFCIGCPNGKGNAFCPFKCNQVSA